MKNRFLFTIKPHLDGPVVDTWHKITDNDHETKSVLWALTVRVKVNAGAEGPFMINTDDDEWTSELLEVLLRSYSRDELRKFLNEARLDVPAPPVMREKKGN